MILYQVFVVVVFGGFVVFVVLVFVVVFGVVVVWVVECLVDCVDDYWVCCVEQCVVVEQFDIDDFDICCVIDVFGIICYFVEDQFMIDGRYIVFCFIWFCIGLVLLFICIGGVGMFNVVMCSYGQCVLCLVLFGVYVDWFVWQWCVEVFLLCCVVVQLFGVLQVMICCDEGEEVLQWFF